MTAALTILSGLAGEVVGIVYGPGPTPRTAGFEWATPITTEDYNQWARDKSFDPATAR